MRQKKAVYNILTSLTLQIIVLISGFITRKLIIQSFGSNVNGLVTSITQFLSYITLLESGIGPVIKAVLYKPIAKKNLKQIENILFASEKFFKNIAKIFIIYLLCLGIFYPLIVRNEFNYLYTMSLIIIISISTFAEYYFGMTYKLYLQAKQNSWIISLIQIFVYLINTIIIFVLIKLNFSIHLVKLLSGFIFVLRPIIQNLYVKKNYNITFQNVDKNYKFKQKWDGLAQHIANIIHANTDVTILTLTSNLIEVSIYSVYSVVTNGLKLIVQSFNEAMEAIFGNMIANEETKNLQQKFGLYEIFYFSIISIIYGCSIILITPFVKVYTLGIQDANYSNYIFGYLIVIAELCWAIRQPYNNLIKSAGHFKQTQVGAWIEAASNVVISLILVYKFGLVGVAIGTLVAMFIRMVEFIYHTNKYILNRKISINIKKIVLLIVEVILIVFSARFLPLLTYSGYINWFLNALMIFIVALTITLIFKMIFYKKELKLFCKYILNIKKVRKK